MPLPPGSSTFPPAVPSRIRRLFWVAERAPNGSYARRGPYIATCVPTAGSLQVASGQAGQMVDVEATIYFTVQSGIRTRSIVTDVLSGASYECLQVKQWPDFTEAYVRRSAADA